MSAALLGGTSLSLDGDAAGEWNDSAVISQMLWHKVCFGKRRGWR